MSMTVRTAVYAKFPCVYVNSGITRTYMDVDDRKKSVYVKFLVWFNVHLKRPNSVMTRAEMDVDDRKKSVCVNVLYGFMCM